METLHEIRTQHQKVLKDIFSLLVRYQVLKPHSTTIEHRNSLYIFEKKDYNESRQAEYYIFKSSINRLIETGYLQILQENTTNDLLKKEEDYRKLNIHESDYSSIEGMLLLRSN